MASIRTLLLLALVGCPRAGGPSEAPVEAAPAPAEATPEDPAPPPEDAPPNPDPPGDPRTGLLLVEPAATVVGAPITVTWKLFRQGSCHHQTDVGVDVDTDQRTVLLAYTTWREGDPCTADLVPGGFTTTLHLKRTGTWTGTVAVDGVPRRSFTVEVEAP